MATKYSELVGELRTGLIPGNGKLIDRARDPPPSSQRKFAKI